MIADKKLSTRNDRNTPLSQILPSELKAIVFADQGKEYQKIELLPSSTPTRTELNEEKKYDRHVGLSLRKYPFLVKSLD